ncbi:alpha/beta hydrolase family protein [Salinimicrobium sp. CAU 1759]
MKNIIPAIFFLLSVCALAQEEKFFSTEVNLDPYVKGTLIIPNSSEASPLVIMLQGSGPTDRHGNQSFMKNDALKKLSIALAEEGISTYRYDKRIMQMQQLGIREQDIRFDDFITDAVSVLDHFAEDERFDKLVVLGHSQGSLVGMVAAQNRADAFISVAGVAQPIDSILIQQIAHQMPGLKANAQQSFKELRDSGSTSSYNPVLESIFRPSVQPFILSWIKYEPTEEISKLKMPVLIINGSKDLQVEEAEAEALRVANPDAEFVILKDMNHVLRKIEGDDLENSKSYNEAYRPLHPELVDVLVKFIREVE